MAVKPPKPDADAARRPAPSIPAPSIPEADAPPVAPPAPSTTPARLTHDANFYRAEHARRMGLDGGPDINDVLDGAPSGGTTLGELLPSARAHGHPDLPEVETRPPPFLSPLAAMKDVYLRVKGRASAKTTDLLEGVDLEDLLTLLKNLFADAPRVARAEARVAAPLYCELRDDPGPFVVGFNDPRLTELWRLFLDGWDIWQPQGRDDGVELFWEGEAEDERGRAIEAVQSLMFVDGEAVLHTKLGPLEDRLTFDGEGFYRLKVRP